MARWTMRRTKTRSEPRALASGSCARACLILLLAAGALWAQSPKYGVGRTPAPEEIRQWDSSVGTDGAGLPEGSGTALQGKEIYANRCGKCHGAKGEGGDSVPVAGGQGTLKNLKP